MEVSSTYERNIFFHSSHLKHHNQFFKS